MAQPAIEQLIDLAAFERYINARLPGATGPMRVVKHTAGFSNETFYVQRGDERWVMRRPPAGPLLPTAHDVVREFRFISALHGKARVPRPVLLCEDVSVIGAPFYLMEHVNGLILRGKPPVELAANCIRLHGLRDDLVMLDPFLGIGNSAVAARECGVANFIGFEIDDDYLTEAKRRLSA